MKRQIRADVPAAVGGGAGSLSGALSEFAAAQSEPQVLDLLQEIAVRHFGASRALLLTLETAQDPAHRVARLAGGSSSLGVEVCRPELERQLRAGAPVVTASPAAELPGVPVPAGTSWAVLLPCSVGGSTNAICVFWPTGTRPAGPADLERLRLLAAMAGMAFDRHVAALRGRLLQAGIDNRIRNVLAVIRSVGTRSAERAATIEDFLLHFEGRIDAIGRSQIAAARHGEISFEDLLREELLAQTIQDDTNVSLDGMDVPITAEQAEALNLAIHELAVNAVKFGAFAAPNGSLAVRWWVEGGADALVLNVDWREFLGPNSVLDRPDRAGFGLTYLEHALPFQLNAEVTLEFARRGLRCQIAVPLHRRAGARARTMSGAIAAGRGSHGKRPLERD